LISEAYLLILIDKHSGVPIYRQILDQVKHQILTGQLKEDEALMSVRDLSDELKVNPMTISKSYSLLEHEGFVERRRGIGLFVTKPKQDLTQRAKVELIEEKLSHVVVEALHMGLTEEKMLAIVSKKFREINASKEKVDG
jgi:GntR family transcriptional regulator